VSELWQHTKLIRSKNAGPFQLTFDIMFRSRDDLERVVKSGVISAEKMSALYNVPVEKVKYFVVEEVNAIKVTIPRPVFSGDQNDRDMYGGQFHSPLVRLSVPD
jgi:hypothetical protein